MAQAQKAPEFVLEDSRGSSVRLSDFRGKVVVVIFASQSTQEISSKTASGLGKRLLQYPDTCMLTVVAVPRMFKAMAAGLIKQAQNKALESAKKRFEKEGVEAPSDLEQRIFILPDWDGAQVKRYGFDAKAKMVHVALIGREGEVLERASSSDPDKIVAYIADKAKPLLS